MPGEASLCTTPLGPNTRVIQEPSDGKKLIKVKVKFFLSATFCHFSPAQINSENSECITQEVITFWDKIIYPVSYNFFDKITYTVGCGSND